MDDAVEMDVVVALSRFEVGRVYADVTVPSVLRDVDFDDRELELELELDGVLCSRSLSSLQVFS